MSTTPKAGPNNRVLWVDVHEVPDSIRYMCRIISQGQGDDYRQSIDGEGMVVRINPNPTDIEFWPGFRDVEALYLKFGGKEAP